MNSETCSVRCRIADEHPCVTVTLVDQIASELAAVHDPQARTSIKSAQELGVERNGVSCSYLAWYANATLPFEGAWNACALPDEEIRWFFFDTQHI